MRAILGEQDEDWTPQLRAIGLALLYGGVAVSLSTAGASIFDEIRQVTEGSPVVTIMDPGRPLGAFFPLLPPGPLSVAVSPWTWVSLAPFMLAHVTCLWRGRLGSRSAGAAIVALAVVKLVILYSLTVELRCGQRL